MWHDSEWVGRCQSSSAAMWYIISFTEGAHCKHSPVNIEARSQIQSTLSHTTYSFMVIPVGTDNFIGNSISFETDTWEESMSLFRKRIFSFCDDCETFNVHFVLNSNKQQWKLKFIASTDTCLGEGRGVFNCVIMHYWHYSWHWRTKCQTEDKLCFTSPGLFMMITIDTDRHRWLQQTLITNSVICREDSVLQKHFVILSSFVCRYPGYKILTDYRKISLILWSYCRNKS